MSLKKAVISLTSLKALDFLFPLALIPLSINIIGIDNYGKIAFFQTLTLFFLTIIDFGFVVSGIQKISVCKSYRIVSNYITASIVIKVYIAIICSFFFILISVFSPFHNETYIIMVFAITILFGVGNFQWFYQAKERYRFILFVSVFSRSFSFILFFVLINERSDYELFSIVLSTMYVIPSIIYIIERLSDGIEFKINHKYVFLIFKNNFDIFLYRVLNAGVLPFYTYCFGFIFSPHQLGAFSLIQRFLGAAINFSSPITQALIPHLAKLKDNNILYYRVEFKKFRLRLFAFSVLITVLIPCVIYLCVKLQLLSGGIRLEYLYLPIVMVLSLSPHILNSFLSQSLVLMGKGNYVKKIIIKAIIVSTPMIVFSLLFNHNLLVFSYVLTYWLMLLLFEIKNKQVFK
ncbi:oligosaccharide flippase family protein [Aliivibrio fischeri]|uniref:oligosaccharide flippase family protein n=1 Tax=Aliivibrio fischeri TaxID=668 RepID=UPI001F2E33E6|nr:oligosaccharide flippase family protein [Aliivibrio fischeri]MCE4935523.1 oligosaccharide flippase family protein [Aliivibrio fischeri]